MVGWSFSVCAGHAVGAVVWAYWGVGEAAEPCGVYDSGDTIGNTPVPVQPAVPISIAAAASAAASSIVAEVTDCLMPSDLDNLD